MKEKEGVFTLLFLYFIKDRNPKTESSELELHSGLN